MTRVGLLVECGPEGLEFHVCQRIVQLINAAYNADVKLEFVTMDNKQRLIEECGNTTRLLLRNGCVRVVILWDERPAWPDRNQPLCWHNDRVDILAEYSSRIEQGEH